MAETTTAPVAHQFDDAHQQREAAILGMWVFLITEVMMFGALFAGYAVHRHAYPESFAIGSRHLNLLLGSINTVVLLTSSLLMSLGMRAVRLDQRKALLGCLTATMLLGVVFLGIKGLEYSHKIHEHLVPGAQFVFEGAMHRQMYVFFSFYFVMTGLHALHLIIGIGMLGTLVVLARQGRFSSRYYAPVELGGLYWHFVDIVWIFLFPLLYLIGRHS
jgi:cytochrome c oxidase subunit 3